MDSTTFMESITIPNNFLEVKRREKQKKQAQSMQQKRQRTRVAIQQNAETPQENETSNRGDRVLL